MGEVHELTQYVVALGLYRVNAPHFSSRSTSTQADTGQTSAHSAHPEQRSSRTMSGEEWFFGAGRIAFSGQVFIQAPQPAQASVTAKIVFTTGTPEA
jgi:hypothetical protein